jgi:hypothetical protein
MPGLPMSTAQCQKRFKYLTNKSAAKETIVELEAKVGGAGVGGGG